MVQNIVAFCTEDQFDAFPEILGLLEDDVGIDETRTIKLVAMERYALTKGAFAKAAAEGPVILPVSTMVPRPEGYGFPISWGRLFNEVKRLSLVPRRSNGRPVWIC